ncbi:hypothetical protein [Lonepinella sp. BR2357]|uniref:hypothetical protein n=1 Tax=Lonepinella sp. BR2357 TaxID=3434549 RepID=UPI003F6DE71B
MCILTEEEKENFIKKILKKTNPSVDELDKAISYCEELKGPYYFKLDTLKNKKDDIIKESNLHKKLQNNENNVVPTVTILDPTINFKPK